MHESQIGRRAALAAGLGPFLRSARAATDVPSDRDVALSIERAHAAMFRRFLDPAFGTTYDYAPPTGGPSLPTPEECRAHKPNALAWWSPIENGGFFGGLYLSALSDRFRLAPTARHARDARRLASGLVRLARLGSTPGFIARGVSTDGAAHFPASSSDQTFPWFYGMTSYLTSGIVKGDERAGLVKLMEEVAYGLEANEWRMPCDRPGFGDFGDWLGAFSASRTTLTGAEPHFDAASRLLFVHLALYQLTGKRRWLDLYRKRRDERPSESARARLEICAQGVDYAPPGTPARYPEHPPLWTSASSQAALRGLLHMDPDAHARPYYRKGLDANATRAARYIDRYRLFDNDNQTTFEYDWRFLNEQWQPQNSIQDAVKLATAQVREWHKRSPRKVYECDCVRDPLFAAWIVTLAGNRGSAGPARPQIFKALTHYEWDHMHTSHLFMAECVYHCGRLYWPAAA